MGRFVLLDGERELARAQVTDQRTHVTGALVLTQGRAVLLANETKGRGLFSVLFGAFGFVMSAMTLRETVTTQIGRTELAVIELVGPNTLKLANRGEGYGYIWFEISLEDAQGWLAMIQYWVEHGRVPGDYATLPVAKVVKRD